MLDKPVSYLFGGIRNSERKVFMKTFPQIHEFYSLTLSDDQEIANKAEAKMNMLVEECEFMDIKDNKVVYTGDKKSSMSTTLTRSMSLFTKNEIESFSEQQYQEMKSVRVWWESRFKLVNVTRMKRIALLYLQLCPKGLLITQGAKWINKHGGRPLSATKFSKNATTAEILKSDIENMKNDTELWHGYKSEFKINLVDNDLSAGPQEINQAQMDFIDSIGDFKDNVELDVATQDPDVKDSEDD
jgi:hypothetical protein